MIAKIMAAMAMIMLIQNEPVFTPEPVIVSGVPEINVEKFTNPSGGTPPVESSVSCESGQSVSAGRLTKSKGVYQGPSGKETWYNLPMGGVIKIMRGQGYSEEEYPYWIRDDGVKMFGDYIMLAQDVFTIPRGTILETSLGPGMVCDHCVRAEKEKDIIDIAVNW